MKEVTLNLLSPSDLAATDSYRGNIPPQDPTLPDEIYECLSPLAPPPSPDTAAPLAEVPPLTPPTYSDRPSLLRYLDKSSASATHDLTLTPLCVLYVLTTHESPCSSPQEMLTSVAETIRSLPTRTSGWGALPSNYTTGQYDPQSIRRHYLILHDKLRYPDIDLDVESFAKSLRTALPHTPLSVLAVNTLPVGGDPHPDVWSPELTQAFVKVEGPVATRLSTYDILNLRAFLQDLVSQSVLSSLERRIYTLVQTTENKRKGVRNMLGRLWRKPVSREEEEGSQRGAVWYHFSTVEASTRLLADSLFLAGDFAGALANYKLLAPDYRTDKANVHLGSTLFMTHLCSVKLGDAQTAYKSLIEAIQSLRPPPTNPTVLNPKAPITAPTRPTVATRVLTRVLLQYLVVYPPGGPLVPGVLTSLTQLEIPALTAALHDLSPPLGLNRAIAAVYYHKRPDFSMRAALSCPDGPFRRAHLIRLLTARPPSVSVPTEALLGLVKAALPELAKDENRKAYDAAFAARAECVGETVGLVTVENRIEISTKSGLDSGARARGYVNAATEEGANTVENVVGRMLDLEEEEAREKERSQRLNKKVRVPRTANVLEPITLTAFVDNDVFYDVDLKSVKIIASVEGSEVEVDPVDIKIPRRKKAYPIKLSLTPKVPGKLSITGIRWEVGSKAWVEHRYDIPGDLLNDSRENKASGARAPNNADLNLTVTSPRPQLELDVGPRHRLPMHSLTPVQFKVTNSGTVVAENLLLVTSHPWLHIDPIGPSGRYHRIASSVAVGESLDITVWIYPLNLGEVDINLELRYNHDGSKFYSHCFDTTLNLDVVQTAMIMTRVTPSYARTDEYLVAVEIDASQEISVSDIVGYSRSFRIKGVAGDDRVGVGMKGKNAMHILLEQIAGGDDGERPVTKSSLKDSDDGGVVEKFMVLVGEGEKMDRLMRKEREERWRKQKVEGEGPMKSIQEIRREANKKKGVNVDEEDESKVSQPTMGTVQSITPLDVCGIHLAVKYSSSVEGTMRSYANLNTLVIRPRADETASCPLLVTCDYDQDVKVGDVRDIYINIRNRLFGEGGEVQYVFEVGAVSGVEINGSTVFTGTLGPGEQRVVKLKALYLVPGVFSLQNVRVQVKGVPFLFPFHWLVKCT